MKKIFLGLLLTLLSQSLHARYFDPEGGRFINRDPLEYVDGMNLYAGYFAQRFQIDPMGTEITETKPEGHRSILDSMNTVKDVFNKDTEKDKSRREAIKKALNLPKLTNKCFTVKVYYITEEDNETTMDQYFDINKSLKNKKCFATLYFGHGDTPTQKKLNAMKDSFDFNKSCEGTKHGMYSCYGGNYNEILDGRGKKIAGSKERNPIGVIEVIDQFGKDYKSIIEKLEKMCKCCDEKPVLYILLGDLNAKPD